MTSFNCVLSAIRRVVQSAGSRPFMRRSTYIPLSASLSRHLSFITHHISFHSPCSDTHEFLHTLDKENITINFPIIKLHNKIRPLTSYCHVPSPDWHVPSYYCHVPSPDFHVPSHYCHVPSLDWHVPSHYCHVPSPDFHVPSPDFHVPSHYCHVPSHYCHVPSHYNTVSTEPPHSIPCLFIISTNLNCSKIITNYNKSSICFQVQSVQLRSPSKHRISFFLPNAYIRVSLLGI
jgi:hypothetical protein